MPKPAEMRDNKFKPTIFNKIEEQIASRGIDPDSIFPLHVGDTWFDLPEEVNMPLENESWNNRLSRYGPTQGDVEQRTRLMNKARTQNNLPVDNPKQIQITFGATGALFLMMRKLLEPGAEILTLSPYWAILRVVAATAGVKLVEIPIFDRLPENPDESDIESILSPYLTEKTGAVYFNSPNNPSGVLLRSGHIEKIAEFAKKQDLWVFSDEAYEDFVWTDDKYLSIGSLPGMFERTVSVFSMSKSFAGAGLRMGCVVAPEGVIADLNPAHVGVGYEPNRLAQVQWIRCLERQDEIIQRLRKSYMECRQAALDNIKVPYLRPEGSFYLFLDLRDKWQGLSYDEKIAQMLDVGVIMSPGEAFGDDYSGWARFCYTAEKPDRIAEAARRVNQLK